MTMLGRGGRGGNFCVNLSSPSPPKTGDFYLPQNGGGRGKRFENKV